MHLPGQTQDPQDPGVKCADLGSRVGQERAPWVPVLVCSSPGLQVGLRGTLVFTAASTPLKICVFLRWGRGRPLERPALPLLGKHGALNLWENIPSGLFARLYLTN